MTESSEFSDDWLDDVAEELAADTFDLDHLLELRRDRTRGIWPSDDYDWGDE